MKRETFDKAKEIITKINRCEAVLKIFESPAASLQFYVKGYREPGCQFIDSREVCFQFEKEEIEILIERKKKQIEQLKEELEKL